MRDNSSTGGQLLWTIVVAYLYVIL